MVSDDKKPSEEKEAKWGSFDYIMLGVFTCLSLLTVVLATSYVTLFPDNHLPLWVSAGIGLIVAIVIIVGTLVQCSNLLMEAIITLSITLLAGTFFFFMLRGMQKASLKKKHHTVTWQMNASHARLYAIIFHTGTKK